MNVPGLREEPAFRTGNAPPGVPGRLAIQNAILAATAVVSAAKPRRLARKTAVTIRRR